MHDIHTFTLCKYTMDTDQLTPSSLLMFPCFNHQPSAHLDESLVKIGNNI